MLTQARLKELFDYDPETGRLIRAKGVKGAAAGEVAGLIGINGYVYMVIDYKNILGHRAVWLWVYGCMPEGRIDHINGERSDNRIENLRLATNGQNMYNAKKYRNNTSGYKGVCWHKPKQKWRAIIKVEGKQRCLGYFDDKEAARVCVAAAREKLHGEFARHE